jgi:hypothetical protein
MIWCWWLGCGGGTQTVGDHEALSPSIDRVIHHGVILDMMAVESYCGLQATHQHLHEFWDDPSANLISL